MYERKEMFVVFQLHIQPFCQFTQVKMTNFLKAKLSHDPGITGDILNLSKQSRNSVTLLCQRK